MENFNPKDYVMDMRGKDYLEVKWRLVWFRIENPLGGIQTEIVLSDPVVVKASVYNGDGVLLGTGMGTPKMQGVAKLRPFEGAETAAIGRALGVAGYGTQFMGDEMDEGEHLADSPVERENTKKQPVRPYLPAFLKNRLAVYAKKSTMESVTDRERQVLASILTAAFGDEQKRHVGMAYLVGQASTKELSSGMVDVLFTWLGGNVFGFVPEKMVMVEAQAVYTEALKQQGQQELV